MSSNKINLIYINILLLFFSLPLAAQRATPQAPPKVNTSTQNSSPDTAAQNPETVNNNAESKAQNTPLKNNDESKETTTALSENEDAAQLKDTTTQTNDTPAEAATEKPKASAATPSPQSEVPTSKTQSPKNTNPKSEAKSAPQKAPVHWRRDKSLRRRPGSYLGGNIGYMQAHAWLTETDDYRDLKIGPIHSYSTAFRVGDAFADWITVGLVFAGLNAKSDTSQIAGFSLALDATFYPIAGLGLRPGVGVGMGYAQGSKSWESAAGGPGSLSFNILYEFRITRRFTLAPIVGMIWITGNDFNSFFMTAGIDITTWFATPTG